jgi:hypothetical protein
VRQSPTAAIARRACAARAAEPTRRPRARTPRREDAPAEEIELAQAAPTPAPRASLRDAAAAVLAAWDDEANRETDMITALDGADGGPPRRPRRQAAPRAARARRAAQAARGHEAGAVLALLRREEGATIAQICEATGWQQHTVRGFFAGLKKRQGIEVQVLERIRQVGPNKEGAPCCRSTTASTPCSPPSRT